MSTQELRRDGTIVALVTVLGLLALGWAVSADHDAAGAETATGRSSAL